MLKVKLETIPVTGSGVEIESETEAEKLVLKEIWNSHGGPASLTRLEDGNVQLVIAPMKEGE